MVSPGLPFDEYRICNFRPWKSGEVIYVSLSPVYGTVFPLLTARPTASNPFFIKDALALLIIVYSAKRRDGSLARVGGVPTLLDKILQDATAYFLVLFTSHLLLFLCEIFAPVSDLFDLRSTAHDRLHVGSD